MQREYVYGYTKMPWRNCWDCFIYRVFGLMRRKCWRIVVGTCGKCGLKQKITKCTCKKNAAAQVLIEDNEKKKRMVSMFNKTIQLLVSEIIDEGNDDVQIKLDPKYFMINSQNVVVRFENYDTMID